MLGWNYTKGLSQNIHLLCRLPRKVSTSTYLCLDLISAYADRSRRILIASIRNMGTCPCPRCLIPLNRVHNMGTTRDMAQRVSLARVDNEQRRYTVTAARRVIYDKKYQVNSAAVEKMLRPTSLVPNIVRRITLYSKLQLLTTK